jgi:hypothetical protein
MHRILTLAALTLLVGTASQAVAQGKSTKAKIANAVSAAPRAISANAAVMDWPATEGGQMTTLRAGTNGYTCLPDFPKSKGNDPMCVDDQWMGFMGAMMTKATPKVTHTGIAYMIAPGSSSWGSNTDPGAEKATADNEWGNDPPHIMLIVTDPSALEGIPTTRQSGTPWVMWRGTPYAHIMVPVAPTSKK